MRDPDGIVVLRECPYAVLDARDTTIETFTRVESPVFNYHQRISYLMDWPATARQALSLPLLSEALYYVRKAGALTEVTSTYLHRLSRGEEVRSV